MNLRIRDEQRPIKIAVIEQYGTNQEEAIRPFDLMTSQHDSWNWHPTNVISVIRSLVPNAEIHLVEKSKRGYHYIVDNDIHLVNMSLAGPGKSTYDYILRDSGIMLVCSAGNSKDRGESWNAQQDHWLSVGAVDKDLKPKYYSSYGKGVVDTVAITPTINAVTLQGTSFTSPFVVGMLAQWFIWYKECMGVYPSRQKAHDFVKFNSHDIWDDGKDMRTGHGLFRLPEVFEAYKTVVTEGERIAKKITYTEGKQPLTIEYDIHAEAKIMDSRLYIPMRGMAEMDEKQVLWDPDKHQATFI